MIIDTSKEPGEKPSKRKSSKPVVEQVLGSKEFDRLEPDQIHRFVDEHEVIYCVQYMDGRLSPNKLMRLYFLLFQVAVKSGGSEAVRNFLARYSFQQKIKALQPAALNLPEKTALRKLACFLDSHRQESSARQQINSLAEDYHEYRILDSQRSNPFVLAICSALSDYINSYMPLVLNEIVYQDWSSMGKGAFLGFYDNYCRVCTLCKRVNHIKCGLMALDNAEIPGPIRQQIEDKYAAISSSPEEPRHKQSQLLYQIGIKKQPVVQNHSVKPGISVKRKLKAMNEVISKMQQQV